MSGEQRGAFAPGRVNLIGEHTDYNGGLALPFAIEQGVTVIAEATADERVYALARDLDERDEFALGRVEPAPGWRAFVRGVAAELLGAGWELSGTRLEIRGELPRGAGLSSSAALEVALSLALIALAHSGPNPTGQPLDRRALARLCARVENDWVGAQTGLLDQLASLYGERDAAVLIDFLTLDIERVPLELGGWSLAVLDSGESHAHASSGYNQRRAECRRACELLGVPTLREAEESQLERLPQPLQNRARHVLEECARVRLAVQALRIGDLPALGALLDASHASLRDLYEVSTPAVERAVARLREAGAAGARLVGGGFGGSVLGLFAPSVRAPAGAREVHPGPGARLL